MSESTEPDHELEQAIADFVGSVTEFNRRSQNFCSICHERLMLGEVCCCGGDW